MKRTEFLALMLSPLIAPFAKAKEPIIIPEVWLNPDGSFYRTEWLSLAEIKQRYPTQSIEIIRRKLAMREVALNNYRILYGRDPIIKNA